MKAKGMDSGFSNQSQNLPDNGSGKATIREEDKIEHKKCNVCSNCHCSEKNNKNKQTDETHSSQ
jgi:hypothetical protein